MSVCWTSPPQILGIDPAELRRLNMIEASEMPYTVGVTRLDGRNTVYDSGDYPSAFNRTLEEIGYDELTARQGHRTNRAATTAWASRLTSSPLASVPFEGARVLVTDEGGAVEVYLGITTMGQGHETVMAQICADSLSVPIEDISDYLPRQHRLHTQPASAPLAAVPRSWPAAPSIMSCQTLRARILSLAASYTSTLAPEALDLRHGLVTF